jgi:hypothetical protein
MCADICIHDKDDGNPHAHIMLTMRAFSVRGEWAAKSKKEYILDKNGERIKLKSGEFKTRKIDATNWNDQANAEEWRAGWADAINAALERRGIENRIDHRSFERQGIGQIPTIHLGPTASRIERRGIRSERGDRNREIVIGNKQIRLLWARINHLKDWIKEETKTTTPPTLAGMIQGILDAGEQRNRYGQIRDLKSAVKALNYLSANHISTLTELRKKVMDMYRRLGDVRDSLKSIDRRLRTLDEHFKQAEIYRTRREVYEQYRQLKPRKQPKFYEVHRADLMMYEASVRYLTILNGQTLLLQKWKTEREELIAERGKAYRQYYAVKEQVADIEIIRRTAENVVREAVRETNPLQRKPREMERER